MLHARYHLKYFVHPTQLLIHYLGVWLCTAICDVLGIYTSGNYVLRTEFERYPQPPAPVPVCDGALVLPCTETHL
eukprot:1805220-Pleurochrysis_carterae.AAC.1